MSEPGNGKKVALMASEAAGRDDQDEDGLAAEVRKERVDDG